MNYPTWLKKLLLPYEFEAHPLHCPKQEEPGEEWDDLGDVYLTGRPDAFKR